VPESFASYQLARLPSGLGAYLALTGAALTSQELVELGLATHATESQAVARIETELGEQRERHLGRLLRNVEIACIEPRRLPAYTEAHALYYLDAIAECFGGARNVADVLTRLQSGSTEWHGQAHAALEASSPLALSLTFAMLNRASADLCWTEVLQTEAAVSATAAGSPDCARGARGLEGAKREMVREAALLDAADIDEAEDDDDEEEGLELAPPSEGAAPAWEHASLADVEATVLADYFAASH